jgi:hypothetical protein
MQDGKIHTDEHPYRGPATIVSLRPVTLRPCLSTSLPSGADYSENTKPGQSLTDERLSFRMNGEGRTTFETAKSGLFLRMTRFVQPRR